MGDSGGALFRKSGPTWFLAGILWGASLHPGQPDPQRTAVEGNLTVAADVAHYRNQILTIIQVPGCSDGLDDDLDGLTDFPADPGCSDADDVSERSPDLRCDDGIDNDGDGLIDHPADPECTSPLSPTEAIPIPAGAGWSSITLALTLFVLGAVHLHGPDQSSIRTL